MKQPAIFLVKLCISGMLLAAIAWAQTGDDWRIDTFAGGPAIGDGGPAAEALFRDPNGVAVDGAGNLYIADTKNRRIRKVDSTGTITTIAGTGEYGFGGDGGPAAEAQLGGPSGVAVDGAGNLYIADLNNGRIRKVDSTGTITTIAGSGEGIVKLRLTAVFDAQHGGFETGWSPISWGSIAELFVNLTMPPKEPIQRVTRLRGPCVRVTV